MSMEALMIVLFLPLACLVVDVIAYSLLEWWKVD